MPIEKLRSCPAGRARATLRRRRDRTVSFKTTKSAPIRAWFCVSKHHTMGHKSCALGSSRDTQLERECGSASDVIAMPNNAVATVSVIRELLPMGPRFAALRRQHVGRFLQGVCRSNDAIESITRIASPRSEPVTSRYRCFASSRSRRHRGARRKTNASEHEAGGAEPRTAIRNDSLPVNQRCGVRAQEHCEVCDLCDGAEASDRDRL